MSSSVFNKILVPTDGSKNSNEAAELAFRLGKNQDAQVILLHVIDLQVLEQSVNVSDKSREEVKAKMTQEGQTYLSHLERVAQGYSLQVRLETRSGSPHDEIVDYAGENRIDLIVMGHAGRRGPRRKIVGSVAERVMRFSHCPVMVVSE